MDELSDALGQLSTSAKEWKPASSQATTNNAATTNSNGAASESPYSSPKTQRVLSSALKLSPPGRTVTTREPPRDWTLASPKEFVPSSKEFVPASSNWGAQQQQQQNDYAGESQETTTTATETVTETSVPSGPAPPLAVRTMHSLGVSDEMWRHQRDMTLESMKEMDPSDPRHKAIPPPFSNAYQLDDISRSGSRSSFGYPTAVFKCLNQEDGNLYCLRRVDNVRSVSFKIASAVTDRWNQGATLKSGLSPVEHPGVVRFYRCFVSNRAVFFLHQYIPGARTLSERFTNTQVPMPEPLLWSCIVQLVAAIRAVHAGNMACRVLQLNHVLCTTPDGMMDRIRVQINCLGVVDALEFEARKQVGELQLEDMRDLGRLILSLASGAEITRNSDNDTMRRCDVFVAQNYSREVHNLAFSLIAPNANTPSIHDVCRAISGRVFDEMDLSRVAADRTSAALGAEYESGRALRLLLKLGFVNERPEFGMNRRWTESGDCYVLMLFRDYGKSRCGLLFCLYVFSRVLLKHCFQVFHQADGSGRPVMDLGHVITCLNKLDAADEEKIVLTSRDGKSMFVVSYAEVARCLDNAFNELCGGNAMGALQYKY